jgi:hypothetical protein
MLRSIKLIPTLFKERENLGRASQEINCLSLYENEFSKAVSKHNILFLNLKLIRKHDLSENAD